MTLLTSCCMYLHLIYVVTPRTAPTTITSVHCLASFAGRKTSAMSLDEFAEVLEHVDGRGGLGTNWSNCKQPDALCRASFAQGD